MRDIKYKAYIKNYDKIVDVDRLGLNSDGSVQEIIVSDKELDGTNEWTDFQAGQFELMEFTGQHDNEGNEVHTGHIIKCSTKHNVKVIQNFCAEVIWDSHYSTYGIVHPTEDFFPLWDIYNYKIIGNVYQNKELLNE